LHNSKLVNTKEAEAAMAHMQDERRTTNEDSDARNGWGDRQHERTARRWSDDITDYYVCSLPKVVQLAFGGKNGEESHGPWVLM